MTVASRPADALSPWFGRWSMVALLTAVALLARPDGGDASGELEVRAADGLVTVRARGVPLSDVLDRISAQTRLKLVYEGARPAQRVSVDLVGMPEPEALRALLEGLGLSFALRTDEDGRHATFLLLADPAATRPSVARPAPAPAPPEPVLEEEPAPPDPALETAPDPAVVPVPGAVFDATSGTWVMPGAVPPGPSGPLAGTPGSGSTVPTFPAGASMPMAPQFPGQASMPMAPQFPGQASMPMRP
jgi:hypothetical protein